MLDEAALYEVLGQMPPRSAEIVSRVALDGWSLPELAERYGIPEANAARLVLRAARDCDAAARGASTPAAPLSDEAEASQAPALARALERLPRRGDATGQRGLGGPPKTSPGGDAPGRAEDDGTSHARQARPRPSEERDSPAAEPTAPHAPQTAAGARAAGRHEPGAAGLRGDALERTADAAPAEQVKPLADVLGALAAHRDGLKRRLADAEAAAARSPARAREVWLRRIAIAVILALTAYFYWRDQHAPPPPPLPRPALPPGGH
ncbi:MAG: sigma factor-like helix-turn-helix DNA-binding protein [Myxococcota bacterium]|jgi:hypothetical protein